MQIWKHHEDVHVDVLVVSDWATSVGMMMISGAVVKHRSRTSATRALRTDEAEHCAVVTGAAEGHGMLSWA